MCVKILAYAAPERERHRRRGRGRGGADLVDEFRLDAVHQIGRAGEDRPAGWKAQGDIVADFRIERDLTARKQKMRRRLRRRIGRGEGGLAHLFPRRRVAGLDRNRLLHGDARRDPHRQRVVRLIERNPGDPVAEEVLPFAALDRRRRDVEGGGMHALMRAVDRRQPQHMVRVGDGGVVVVDRLLADVVDHPSASHGASERSRVVK